MKKRALSRSVVLVITRHEKNTAELLEFISGLGFDTVLQKIDSEEQIEIGEKNIILSVLHVEAIENHDLLQKKIDKLESVEVPVILFTKMSMFADISKSTIFQSVADVIFEPLSKELVKSKILRFRELNDSKLNIKLALEEIEVKKKRLEDDKHKLKILTSAVNEPIIFVNQDLTVTFWNKEAQHIFGYGWYEVVSESFLHWLVAKKSHKDITELFQKARKGGIKQLKRSLTFNMRTKLGVEIKVEATISYYRNNDKEFNLVFVIHDISKQKRLEREAIKSRELREENKLMREQIKDVTRDLKTQLNAVKGISSSIINFESKNLSKKQEEGLEIIYQSSNHLLEYVGYLQNISRIDSKSLMVNVEKFDFDKMLAFHKSRMLQLIKEKPIRIVLKRSPSVPGELFGDLRKINQVLSILLTNAEKYTQKGKISISTHLVENKLFFEIADTGEGIPKSKLTNIFGAYSVEDESDISATGTGLGLHISRKLVELMNGEISVESEKGKGTVFRFYLTLPEVTETPIPEVFLSDFSSEFVTFSYKENSKLILVVDDSNENTFYYRILGESKEYSVILIRNGKKAPAAIRDYAPDLLILNMEMSGMHGATIIRELRNKRIIIPVIAISEFEKLPSVATYNVQLISKPLTTELLLSTIVNEVKWIPKKNVEQLIVFEDKSWIRAELEVNDISCLVENKSYELAYIQILQKQPKRLIIENVERTANSLPLILRLISKIKYLSVEEIHLQYEGTPMQYLLKKIEGYSVFRLTTKSELKKLI